MSKEQRKEPNRGHIAGGEGSYSSIASCQKAVKAAEGKGGEGATRPRQSPMGYNRVENK
jgi:hypothetical protein